MMQKIKDVIGLFVTSEELFRLKGVEVAPFDPNRFIKIFEHIRELIHIPRVIQIIGTNGKGTTGRFIASLLHQQNLQVGHFTSPHLFSICERFWLNGDDISSTRLDEALEKLSSIAPLALQESSYFELATLLSLLVFSDCDWIVLEAGLGGEFDATTVIPKELTVFTPISYDHCQFLGTTIEDIAITKIRAMRGVSIMGLQTYSCVKEIAQCYASEHNYPLTFCEESSVLRKDFPLWMNQNLHLALQSVALMGYYPTHHHIRMLQPLRGRCEFLGDNILIDVGHNQACASVLVNVIPWKKYTLIFNAYEDKDYKAVLQELTQGIEEVLILPLHNPRIVSYDNLSQALETLQLPYRFFDYHIEYDKYYVVTGSFSVVENFLQSYDKILNNKE